MKKITYSIALSLISIVTLAQKAVIVNGGVFGSATEKANVMIFDTQSQQTTVIDTIHKNSVQDILIDGDEAYVLATDSIVKYDLISRTRLAAGDFNGISTKTAKIYNNQLVVGNWYGLSSGNLSFYDTQTLAFSDSIHNVTRSAKSILINNGIAYVTQNSNSTTFTDTLGAILIIDLSTKTIIDTIQVPGYTQGIGELIEKPDGTGFMSINSVSNSITLVNYPVAPSLNYFVTNIGYNQNIQVSNLSQLCIYNDTLFLKMNGGIGAINLNGFPVIDTLIVDTIVTAFSYDTLNNSFYITQSTFSGFNAGKVYDRNGVKTGAFSVGFSPEVIHMYYDQITGLTENKSKPNTLFKIYPNPAKNELTIKLDNKLIDDIQSIEILNITGQQVYESNLVLEKNSINISDFNSGVYFVKLNSSDHFSIERLIVQ